MSIYAAQIRNTIRAAIRAAARQAAEEGLFPHVPAAEFRLEVPAERKNGDLSSNAAMVWCKELRLPPRNVAQTLLQALAKADIPARADLAGAGFLNFYFDDAYYLDVLRDVREKGADYGKSDVGKGARVNLEFISANPTGPMHMGNARGGALGDCLAAVLEAAGYAVSREFYVNDAGGQIEKFALSLDLRYRQHFGETIEMPENSYCGADITDLAAAFAAQEGDKWLTADATQRQKALVDFALPQNIRRMHEICDAYRIRYDTWFQESTLHNSGAVAETIRQLTEKGLTYEKDGALWYRASEHGGEKDEVLLRGSGHPTYFAADIAYHRNKFARGFDRAINVWGADHHGHVARLKGALDALDGDGAKLEIVLMQLVRLLRGGKVARMSKRTGNAITLADLLDEIPVDAVRFLFNLRAPGVQMDFDLDLAVEQSAQNPVYYCQYAHARICSIFRKTMPTDAETRTQVPLEPTEKELLRHLGALTDEIAEAASSMDPARITRYCVDLAGLFHKFYTACRVGVEDPGLRARRLAICAAVRDVLKNLLTMFKITVPEEM